MRWIEIDTCCAWESHAQHVVLLCWHVCALSQEALCGPAFGISIRCGFAGLLAHFKTESYCVLCNGLNSPRLAFLRDSLPSAILSACFASCMQACATMHAGVCSHAWPSHAAWVACSSQCCTGSVLELTTCHSEATVESQLQATQSLNQFPGS